jgi:hypothetical protein
MANVSMFWHGNQLTKSHVAAMLSFKKNGHRVKVYVYDNKIILPEGIERADAKNIFPESKVFSRMNSFSSFSDIFRYFLIQKTGETWVDVDTFCFSNYFFEDKSYAFIKETDELYAGGVLKMPSNSPAIKFLIKKSLQIKKHSSGKNNDDWILLGPRLLTEAVNFFNLQKYSIHHKDISMVDFHEEDPTDFWLNPNFLNEMIDRSKSSISATFFNSHLTKNGYDLNNPEPGSALNYFINKYYF